MASHPSIPNQRNEEVYSLPLEQSDLGLHYLLSLSYLDFFSDIWYAVVVDVLLFYVHGKHLWSCQDSQLT